MPANRPNSSGALLSARTALILLFSVLAAAAVTGLLVADGRSLASRVYPRVLSMEDWAEVRRLQRSEGMPIKAIARGWGVRGTL